MKILTIFVLSICSFSAVCQIKNVYCEYHITNFQYKNDTIRFSFPAVFTLKELGCTPIEYLGPFGKNEYGVKLELLKSNVGLNDELILGKCFYIKEGDSWKEIYKSANLQTDIFKGNPCEHLNDRGWVRGSEANNSGEKDSFSFSYMQIIYAY